MTPVPGDHVATIVTSLEMTVRPPARLPPSPYMLKRWHAPASERYRTLFARVGAPWLWFSRLTMPDAQLRAILDDPRVEVYAMIDRWGVELGMHELDFRQSGECELSYLAVVPDLTGKGHGSWLMANALGLGWRRGVTRMWVHTCTLDHPRALGFYIRHGFVPFERSVETFADPRLTGHLPRDAAPHIPRFDPARR